MKNQPVPWNKPFPQDAETNSHPKLIGDYYQRSFFLFHEQLKKDGYNPERPHPIRRRFWSLLPQREYAPIEARNLMLSYIDSVKKELAEVISKQSLAYWLHLYRRLSPESIGKTKKIATTGDVRASLEGAIQKFAKVNVCDRVDFSGNVSIDKVLGGILMGPDFDIEREILRNSKQLVLTSFTSNELREFYEVERLAYELWYGGAALRIIGKEAPIIVDDKVEAVVYDLRTDELNSLVEIYDKRNESWDYWLLSSIGSVIDIHNISLDKSGFVFLPTYNVGKIPFSDFNSLFSHFSVKFKPITSANFFNFIWLPFDLRQFRDIHVPFINVFNDKYGVSFDAVLVVIAALCQRVFYIWEESKGASIFRFWQRAYEGPYLRTYVNAEILAFAKSGLQLLGLSDLAVSRKEILKAIRFWTLNDETRPEIGLIYTGPHSVFLPYGNKRVFIDYAWILRRLYDLFIGLSIPDQNFKGDLLEDLVQEETAVLPRGNCKTKEGKQKQIDAAYSVGTRLIIVECKATGKSIGFICGDPGSIRFRKKSLTML
jgi:hypothetical protein